MDLYGLALNVEQGMNLLVWGREGAEQSGIT
jgi:hypothetical protein